VSADKEERHELSASLPAVVADLMQELLQAMPSEVGGVGWGGVGWARRGFSMRNNFDWAHGGRVALRVARGVRVHAHPTCPNPGNRQPTQVSVAESGICPEASGVGVDPGCAEKAKATGFWEPWL
jgi:hypothetical protein